MLSNVRILVVYKMPPFTSADQYLVDFCRQPADVGANILPGSTNPE